MFFSRQVVSDSVTPSAAARQASLSSTISQSLLKFMSFELVMPSNISPSVAASPPAFISQHQGLFQCVGSLPQVGSPSIRTSASASAPPVNVQGSFPLGWTGFISLLSKGLSRGFSSTMVQKHLFFGAQLSLWSNSHIHT